MLSRVRRPTRGHANRVDWPNIPLALIEAKEKHAVGIARLIALLDWIGFETFVAKDDAKYLCETIEHEDGGAIKGRHYRLTMLSGPRSIGKVLRNVLLE